MGISAVVSLGVQLYSTVQENKASKKQARAQEAALNEQRKQARLQNLSTRRAEARKAMRLRAQARNTAGATGTSNTTALTGSLASIQQNKNNRISFLDTMSAFEDNKFAFQKRANEYASDINDWNAVGQVAGTVYNASGGSKSLEKLF